MFVVRQFIHFFEVSVIFLQLALGCCISTLTINNRIKLFK